VDEVIADLLDEDVSDWFPDVAAVSMGNSLPGPVDHIDVLFSESVREFDAGDVSILGPDGPVMISRVEDVQEPDSYYRSYAYTIHFEQQTTPGEYILHIGPDIVDFPWCIYADDSNPMEAAYEGTFRILPEQVVVVGSILNRFDLEGSSDPLPQWGSHAVSLWEEVGQRDPIPGKPDEGDEPDYVVSVFDEVSGGKYATGTAAFLRDRNGEVILNADPKENDEPRELYVVVYAENEFGAVIDQATITTVPKVADPAWAPLRPWPLPPNVEQQWARTRILGTSPTVSIPEDEPGGYATVEIDLNELFLPFLEWLRLAEQSIAGNFGGGFRGLTPRGWTAMAPVVVGDPYGEDWHDAEHDLLNVVLIPSDIRKDPLSFWQAYAHAIQFAANGYEALPYDPDDAGAIWESDSTVTAYLEGSAASFAAIMMQEPRKLNHYSFSPVVTPRSRYRQEDYLDHNNFWMGFDGYGLQSNREASDIFVDPKRLEFDGVNNNANTGEYVAGAVASMLFELNDVIICLEQWEPHPLTFQSLPDYVESLFEVLTSDHGPTRRGP
jgi:hypothetical protein